MKKEKIWLIDMLIPRKYVRNLDKEVLDQYEEEVDTDTVDDAEAEGIDAEKAVKQQ